MRKGGGGLDAAGAGVEDGGEELVEELLAVWVVRAKAMSAELHWGTSALDGRVFRGWREEALAGLTTRVPVVEGCSSGCSCESQNSAAPLVSGSFPTAPRTTPRCPRAVEVVPHVLYHLRRAGRVVDLVRVALRVGVPDKVHLVVRQPRRSCRRCAVSVPRGTYMSFM